MRRVVAPEFVSLEGVMESPEKWHFPYFVVYLTYRPVSERDDNDGKEDP
jgi:hypothetical protein